MDMFHPSNAALKLSVTFQLDSLWFAENLGQGNLSPAWHPGLDKVLEDGAGHWPMVTWQVYF